MTTTALAKPQTPKPATPRPLWERHQLFQEPTYQDGQTYTSDEESEDDVLEDS